MRLLIFGDSITEGFYDFEKSLWVNRLKTKFWNKDIDVANCGISGYNSSNILNMFSSFFNAYSNRQEGKEKETIIIFSFGINDSSLRDGDFMIPKLDFEKNLGKLLSLCKKEKYIKKVYFFGSINCDEEKTIPVSWGEYYYYNKNIKDYNKIVKEFCKNNNLEFLDLFGILEKLDFYDGLHPNSNGHKKIFEKVYKFLKS